MDIHNKIRVIREIKQWSQEEMAEHMNMSTSGYSKIERGETKLHLDKLKQIAQIFNIDTKELIDSEDKNICFLLNENAHYTNINTNYYGAEALIIEIEKLKMILAHKEEIISQKDNELQSLKEIITLLKKQLSD